MAEISDIVKTKIHNFINLLESNNINIQRAVLFGSYANGTNDEWSDIDLAVVSESFKGNRLDDMLELNNYIVKSSLDISPIPYRPEDFENSMFVRDEILNKGILIR